MSYTEFESLANVLGHCLENPEQHEISFNFPVTELLPPDVKPHLEIPRDLSYREMPDVRAYLPDPNDLNFLHRIPVNITPAMHGVSPDLHSRCLIASIERLSANKGSSTFDIVGYYEGRVIVHHIHLATTWKISSGEVTEVKGFCLDEDEFDYIPTAKETFCNHFIRRGLDADGNEIKLRLKSLENLSEHAVVWVRPPTCRHKIQIEIASLWHATEGKVLMLACDEPGCSALFFSEHERKKIELGFEKRRRQQFLAEQHWWALFDFCTEDRYALVEIGDAQMLQALGIALPSMRAPETVMPGVMSLVDSIEIRAAVAGLEWEFGGAQGLARTMALREAHGRLIQMAEVAIRALVNRSVMDGSNKAEVRDDMVAE
ncbi:hypothetical protein LTS14_009677 [Recurvomyces mirabilis]|uniref:uncharacterized protein n=1 Tax=Recurvomyces mirabilis TaxID=574656 RepID=UPI002DE17DD0|nr:hypothetical protein LTS14_009677 [Recurvomyces mirabilis]